MMAKRRCLMAPERKKLFEDLYISVYAEDLPFHGHGDQIHFENKREIADEQLLDGKSHEDEPEDVVDENNDTDISKNERESDNDDVALPRKQKQSCQKNLLDDFRYEKPPDQQNRTLFQPGRYQLNP